MRIAIDIGDTARGSGNINPIQLGYLSSEAIENEVLGHFELALQVSDSHQRPVRDPSQDMWAGHHGGEIKVVQGELDEQRPKGNSQENKDGVIHFSSVPQTRIFVYLICEK